MKVPCPTAEYVFCGLTVEGEDAKDVFRGAETPIGQLHGVHSLFADNKDPDEGTDK